MEELMYPIGKFVMPTSFTNQQKSDWIETLQTAPILYKNETAGLSDKQQNTPYRPEGWTIKQVVHHVADSHMNSYIRFKLALTEDEPTIKPYDENRWANLQDSNTTNIQVSIQLLEALHKRWVNLLETFTDDDFLLKFYHPDLKIYISLQEALALYAWHSKHHLAHITSLKSRLNW